MFIYFLYYFICISFLKAVWCQREMGPGLWSVKNVKQCPDPEQYEIQVTMERRKYNRTHDCFDWDLCLPDPLDENYGMLAEVYKLCDGGYKFQQNIDDAYACKFVEDNSKDNLDAITNLAGVEPGCPFPKGCYNIENFLVDYEDLPENCVYGEFLILGYLIKNEVKMSCISLELECEEKETESSF